MYIEKKTLESMFEHALEEYPHECCGIITGDKSGQTVHKLKNIQDELHAEDPVRYPRDSRTAYLIDRKEFERISTSLKAQGEHIIAFYHSHPDHGSFFSEEDFNAQTVFGEPEFPDALHLVISVRNGKVHEMKCYRWDKEKSNFIDTLFKMES